MEAVIDAVPKRAMAPKFELIEPQRGNHRRWLLAIVLGTLVTTVGYTLATDHVWEDFLITFRHSKNLVDGHGLVFNPGERVQGFTSFLNTLLPALFYWMKPSADYLFALNAYRATCIVALAAGGAILMHMMLRQPARDSWSPAIFLLLFITEAKTVAFSTNGQEVAFMVLFLAMGLYAAVAAPQFLWGLMGASWTGLLYTRPDAPIYIAGLGLVSLAFRREEGRRLLWLIAKAGLIAAVAYLPWFIFVWQYYGTPIPHTVSAKSATAVQEGATLLHTIQNVFARYPSVAGGCFKPIYMLFGGWSRAFFNPYGHLLVALCAFYWLLPVPDRVGRAASAMFALVTLYFAYIETRLTAYPWYLPSGTMFGLVVLARAPAVVIGRLQPASQWPIFAARAAQAGLVVASATLLALTTVQIRAQQQIVETHHRRQIGLWLNEVARPGDRVFLECLGYIGYFSQAHMLDWPGLVSPQVVELRKQGHRSMGAVAGQLLPEWMVLRPHELAQMEQEPALRQQYEIARTFDVRPQVDKYQGPGKGYLAFDAVFVALRRVK